MEEALTVWKQLAQSAASTASSENAISTASSSRLPAKPRQQPKKSKIVKDHTATWKLHPGASGQVVAQAATSCQRFPVNSKLLGGLLVVSHFFRAAGRLQPTSTRLYHDLRFG